jgi:uncharacterized protein YybS (DUF2232 family)
VLAAVAALLALAAHYIPLLGTAAVFLCPLPLTVLTVRQGLRVAWLAAAVAAAIGTMVGGVFIGISIALGFAPSGIVMGIGIRRGFSAGGIWLLTAGVAIASIAASVGLASLGVGIDPRQVLLQLTQQSIHGQQLAIEFYERFGINTAPMRQVAEQMRQFMEFLPRLVPFLFVAAGATSAYLNLVVARPVLRRMRMNVPAFPPMSTWQVPSWFIWALPVGQLCLVGSVGGGQPFQIPSTTLRMLPRDDLLAVAHQVVTRPLLEAAGMNLVVFAQLIFSLLGLIVGWVLMERYRVPRWYRWVVIFLALSNPIFSLAALLLGLADAALGLRARWRTVSPAPAVSTADPALK